MFAVHAYIHPLEHASALVVRDEHYDGTGEAVADVVVVVVVVYFSCCPFGNSTVAVDCVVAFGFVAFDIVT